MIRLELKPAPFHDKAGTGAGAGAGSAYTYLFLDAKNSLCS